MNQSHRGARRTRRVTLKEIAEVAGVSVSTASLVLSGKGAEHRISANVETRVRQIAVERDYSPNLLVRSMQRGRTHVLSFYNTYNKRDPGDLYMDRLSAAIERAAGAQGYNLLVHCAQGRSADEVYGFLNGGLSDGLLFFGALDGDPLIDHLRTSRLPTVILDHVDDQGQLSCVCDDWRDGMRLVAERLIALGHRHIGVIGGYPASDTDLRIGALREFLAVHDVTLPLERVAAAYRGYCTPDEAIRRLMAGPEPPTAIFCWHDRLGYEVLEACGRLGIRVPEELSLIGYDGLHWPSTSPHILASVSVPIETVAEAAVVLLDDLIMGRRTGTITEFYPVTLTEGTTLVPPPRRQL